MTNSGSIQIFFPMNAAFFLDTSPISCSLKVSTNFINRNCNYSIYSSSQNSFNYIQILDICSSNACTNQIIVLKIINVRNPLSLKPLATLDSNNYYGAQMLTLDNRIIAFSRTSNVSGVGMQYSSFKNVSLNLSDWMTSTFFKQ